MLEMKPCALHVKNYLSAASTVGKCRDAQSMANNVQSQWMHAVGQMCQLHGINGLDTADILGSGPSQLYILWEQNSFGSLYF